MAITSDDEREKIAEFRSLLMIKKREAEGRDPEALAAVLEALAALDALDEGDDDDDE